MKQKTIALFLALALALSLAAPAWAEAGDGDYLGNPLPDFTVETIDGGTFTLSEALQEKDLVFINLWATWCSPCAMEFPYLEEAYAQYQDRVAVIALSVEYTDTPQVLADYVQEHGMTFPVGSDTEIGLSDYFFVEGIPTSLVVDRFGNVAWLDVGSITDVNRFARLFDYFLSEDYTETTVLDAIPPARPNVENPTEAELSAALNAEGGEIVFRNAGSPYTWPMIPAERDGRTVAVSSNSYQSDTFAEVYCTVTAQAGDALAFDFATSTESALDLLIVTVDGQRVKSFGGEHDWTTWVIDLTEGEHEIGFHYAKDEKADDPVDCVWLDEVRLVSGDEADALRAALPVYPVSDGYGMDVVAPGAREIVFDGTGSNWIPSYFSSRGCWIVPEGQAMVEAHLPAGLDPEVTYLTSDYDGSSASARECLTEDESAYLFFSGVDSWDTTGYPWTEVYLVPDSADYDLYGLLFFADEENVDFFVEILADEVELDLTWRYADGDAWAEPEEEDWPLSRYTIYFVDQYGEPVPGVIVNFCNELACTAVTADEDGVAVYETADAADHIQVLRVPQGYAFDTALEISAPEVGGELVLTVTKE